MRHRHLFAAGALGCVCVLRGSAALAEETAPPSADPTPAPQTSDAAAVAPMDTVVVRGKAAPRSASDVELGRDVVMTAPHRTGSDVLDVVPGVFVTQHSGEGKAHQIFLRGFDAVHGQDVELWVGGVPVNEVSNIHGQGYADLHFVMPEVIRRVHSTPGTYDPRQGDFAVAGSIRMDLGVAEPGATVKGTIGSFGTRRLFLAYHPKGEPEETFAAFEDYQTSGFGPNRAARRGSMIAQFKHDLPGGFSLRVLASTYTGRFDSAGVVPAADIESGRMDRFAVLDPKQGGFSVRHQVLTEITKDTSDGHLSIAPFLVFRTLRLRQNYTGYFLDTLHGAMSSPESDNNEQVNESTTAGLTGSYERMLPIFSSRDTIAFGVYGRYDVISQSQTRLSDVDDSPLQTQVDADVRGTDVAGWVDLGLHPLPRVTVRGGIRADVLSYSTADRVINDQVVPAQERSAQGSHLGKKATIDWSAMPRVHLLASYGDGFRSPQARSLADGEKTVFTNVTSYEVGARYRDGQTLEGSIAAFYTRLSQDLVFDPETTRNETVPGTDRRGIAAEFIARAGDLLLLSSSATYTRATFRESDTTYRKGDLLPYVPELVVRSDLAIKHALTRLFNRTLEGRIGTGLQGLVGRPLPYKEMGSNVFLVDASAGLRLSEVELGLDVFNLFDTKWYDGEFVYASNFDRLQSPPRVPIKHVSVGAPRTLWATLTLHL
ncbi:MAG: TonB-dependent receptor [Polyangiaceae bacterium]|nr:TonB-dependent receptor [Polyangiaceae bacterium]